MSVVNKMLQDLEARENEASSISADYQPESRKKKSPLLFALLVVALMVAGAVYFYPLIQKDKTPTAAPPQTLQVVEATAGIPAQSNQQVDESESVSAPEPETHVADTPKEIVTEEFSTVEPVSHEIAEVPVDTMFEAATQGPMTDEPAGTDEKQPEDVIPANNLEAESSEQQQSVFSVSSSQPEKSKASLRELVQYALKNGEEQEAIGLLYRLLESQPENTGGRKKLAAMLFARGQLNEAEAVLNQGLQRQPDNLQMRLMLARLYFQRNDLQQALDTVTSDEVSAFLYPDYVSFRASLAEKLARYDIARQDYHALVESQPDEPRWWLGFAVSLERLNENMLALQAYEKTNTLGQLPDEVMQFVNQRIRYLTGS